MIIVTTPTGNVGSEVARLLVEHEPALPFRLAAHNPAKIKQLYGESVPCVHFDLDDPATWPGALAGGTMLFLVCPRPDPRTIRVQILPLIDAVLKAGCQHIIYQSAPGADHLKLLPHYRIERYIEASGCAYTFLRPGYFMQNFIRRDPTHGVDIATRQEIFLPTGNGQISLIDARDVAAVVVKVCESPEAYKNQGYYLTGQEAYTMDEVARVFSEVFQQPIRNANPSLPRFWVRMLKRGVPWALILVMSIEYTVARGGKSHELSSEGAKITGRSPFTLARFIMDNRQRWITQSWV